MPHSCFWGSPPSERELSIDLIILIHEAKLFVLIKNPRFLNNVVTENKVMKWYFCHVTHLHYSTCWLICVDSVLGPNHPPAADSSPGSVQSGTVLCQAAVAPAPVWDGDRKTAPESQHVWNEGRRWDALIRVSLQNVGSRQQARDCGLSQVNTGRWRDLLNSADFSKFKCL